MRHSGSPASCPTLRDADSPSLSASDRSRCRLADVYTAQQHPRPAAKSIWLPAGHVCRLIDDILWQGSPVIADDGARCFRDVSMRRAQHVFINTSSAYLRCASAIFALTIYHFLSLFTPDLKLICFTNRFLHNLSVFFRDCLHGACAYTEVSGHWRFFVFSFFFGFWLRVLDLADHAQLFSPREALLSYRIVSYCPVQSCQREFTATWCQVTLNNASKPTRSLQHENSGCRRRRVDFHVTFNPLTPLLSVAVWLMVIASYSCAMQTELSRLCNFWHLGTLALSPERQSVRMSKLQMTA